MTTEAAELPAAMQQRFADRLHPQQSTRIRGGHLPLLTDPEAVTKAITAVAGNQQAVASDMDR